MRNKQEKKHARKIKVQRKKDKNQKISWKGDYVEPLNVGRRYLRLDARGNNDATRIGSGCTWDALVGVRKKGCHPARHFSIVRHAALLLGAMRKHAVRYVRALPVLHPLIAEADLELIGVDLAAFVLVDKLLNELLVDVTGSHLIRGMSVDAAGAIYAGSLGPVTA